VKIWWYYEGKIPFIVILEYINDSGNRANQNFGWFVRFFKPKWCERYYTINLTEVAYGNFGIKISSWTSKKCYFSCRITWYIFKTTSDEILSLYYLHIVKCTMFELSDLIINLIISNEINKQAGEIDSNRGLHKTMPHKCIKRKYTSSSNVKTQAIPNVLCLRSFQMI